MLAKKPVHPQQMRDLESSFRGQAERRPVRSYKLCAEPVGASLLAKRAVHPQKMRDLKSSFRGQAERRPIAPKAKGLNLFQ
ncbi:hypothetical protein [Pseudomonas sp. v388]|uniref:hypothetical protein n=1 Tax=Pseudomonas sp. v388 TaxID=2479849 RepID=UPI0015AF76B8|nr:hypothetical protein [Pseudomonas sp. v388]